MIVAIVILNTTAFLLLRAASDGGCGAWKYYLGVAWIVACELLDILPAVEWKGLTLYLGNALLGIGALFVALRDKKSGVIKSVLKIALISVCAYYVWTATQNSGLQGVAIGALTLTAVVGSVALVDSPPVCAMVCIVAIYVASLISPIVSDEYAMTRYLTNCGGLSVMALGGAVAYILRKALHRGGYAYRVEAKGDWSTEAASEWLEQDSDGENEGE